MTTREKLVNFLVFLLARPSQFKFWKRVTHLSLRFTGVGNYDEEGDITGENWVLNRLIKKHNIKTFFDVGANLGQYSVEAKSLNSDIIVYAFEAHPKTFEKLKLAVQGYEKFNVINVAVGNPDERNRSIQLYDYADNDGSQHASIYKEVFSEIHLSENLIQHEIELMALSEFCKKNSIDHISFLKIDTEGNEIDVLRGMTEFIDNSKIDFIQFEFNSMNLGRHKFLDFWNILHRNYTISRLLPRGLGRILEYNSVDTEVYIYQNYLAVRKGIDV